MTANLMADNIELHLNKVGSLAAYGYEDSELSSFLNKAQELYIDKFFDELSNRKATGFEETEARGQGLSALIKPATCTVSTSQTGVFANGFYYDLPSDFRWCLTEVITSNKLHCKTNSSIVVDVKVISHDEYNRLKTNYYRKPFINAYEGLVWRMYESRFNDGNIPGQQTSKRHQLITSGDYTITSYFIKYIKEPPTIVVDRANIALQRNCILDNETHEKIVEIAVGLIDNSNKDPNSLYRPDNQTQLT